MNSARRNHINIIVSISYKNSDGSRCESSQANDKKFKDMDLFKMEKLT